MPPAEVKGVAEVVGTEVQPVALETDVATPANALDTAALHPEAMQPKTDVLGYFVVTLCAIDIVLSLRLLKVRTMFGLLFSTCGLYGSSSRRQGFILLYVVHTLFTLVRGVIHTGTVMLLHINNLQSERGPEEDELTFQRSQDASYMAIVVLGSLEMVEALIASAVYGFFVQVKAEELRNAALPDGGTGQSMSTFYAPAEGTSPSDTHAENLQGVAAADCATKSTTGTSSALSGSQIGLLRRRGKKTGRR